MYRDGAAERGSFDGGRDRVQAAGWSAKSAAGQFRYTTGPPPTIKPPTVTGISPASGDDFGGDTVTITGTGFTGASAVDFGGTFSGAQSYTVVNDTHITAVTPESSSGGAGTVDVTVFNSAGASKVTSKDRFGYVHRKPIITKVTPKSGPTTGGTTVTVSGRYFNAGTVELPGLDVTSTCTPTRCTFTTVAAAAGTVDVAVDAFDGSSAKSAADRFRFVPRRRPLSLRFPPRRQQCREHAADRARHEPRGRHGLRQRPAGPPVRHRGKSCTLTACSVYTPAGKTGTARVVVKRPTAPHLGPSRSRTCGPASPSSRPCSQRRDG